MNAQPSHTRRLARVAGLPLACVLAALILGCAADHKADFARDGIRYGQTEGRFRGRWWNYYERGRSFADGRFWTEAESDLRKALEGRRKDQFWPRTYGLHFTREYFPHRELGVVLFSQERFQEAIAEIEMSYAQQPSARAAYYLDRARAAWISKGGLDKLPPAIRILEPADGLVSSVTTVEIRGTILDDTYARSINVSGQDVIVPVSAPELSFVQTVSLKPGDNRVVVSATDLADKSSEVTISVYLDADGPSISFDVPVVIPGPVRGVVFDPSGIKGFTIAQKPAQLVTQDSGQMAFLADIGQQQLVPPILYEAEDTLGNITRGVLPVTTLVVSEAPVVVPAGFSETSWDLGNGIRAVTAGRQLIALTSDTSSAGTVPTVEFTNLTEGQKYLMYEIVVALNVESSAPIKSVAVNGAALTTIPGRTLQRLSRRIPLEKGPNQVEAYAEDEQGQKASSQVRIERQLTQIELPVNQLSVALLGTVRKGSVPVQDADSEATMTELSRELKSLNRFNIVDRSLLPEILAEQELSAALGQEDRRLAMGKLIPAELMLIGTVRRDAQSIEMTVDAISTETSVFVASADVAGPADSLDQLRRLVKDLALRIAQEFPRASGKVALVKTPDLFVTNLSRTDRVRPSMKCTVFRPGDDIPDPAHPGQSLGRDTVKLADALIQGVDDRKSTVERVASGEPQSGETVQVGDDIATK